MACARLHNFVIDCQLKRKKYCEDNDDNKMSDDDDDEDDFNLSVTQLSGAPLGLPTNSS